MKDLVTQIAEAGLAVEQSRNEQIAQIDATQVYVARIRTRITEDMSAILATVKAEFDAIEQRLITMRDRLEKGAEAAHELEGLRRIVDICRPASSRASEAGLAAVSQAVAAE